MKCYLDNAATTQALDKAAEKMVHALRVDYGNPSSLHNMGMDAENLIKDSRQIIAKTLKAKPGEIVFTSGGSESNNLAIFGTVRSRKRYGRHIITTMVEHPAVREPLAALEAEGYEVTRLHVDSRGIIYIGELEKAMRDDTVLVSIMHVNNEIGSVMPIEDAASVIHSHNPNTYFHVDAIQSYGKIPVFPGRIGVDLMSVSGHKLHGPKGSGFLYVRDGISLSPIIYGGGQESGLRSGTENVPAIAGLGVAVADLFEDHESKISHMRQLRNRLCSGLLEIDGISINGPDPDMAAPHIVSTTVRGVRAEVLLHALEEDEIYCSAGSACSSNRPAKSKTLAAIGLKGDALEQTVRFSLSVHTTEEEIEYALVKMSEIVPRLARFVRR